MEKIKCEACGREVLKKGAVVWFDPGTSHAYNLCMACYYQKLAGIGTSDICRAMERRSDDDNADSQG